MLARVLEYRMFDKFNKGRDPKIQPVIGHNSDVEPIVVAYKADDDGIKMIRDVVRKWEE